MTYLQKYLSFSGLLEDLHKAAIFPKSCICQSVKIASSVSCLR